MKIWLTTIVLLVSYVLIGSGCSRVAADQAQPAPGTADPKIAEALALIEKMPGSTRPYVHLATLYIQKARRTGEFALNAEAEAALDKAREIDPTDLALRKLTASLHLTNHRFKDGLAAGNELLTEIPSDPFVYGVIADAHTELGNYDEAVKAAQKMVDLKPNSQSYARVAHLRWLHGDHKGAIEMYTLAARTADPNEPEAQSWCLTQLADEYRRSGDPARAMKVYDEALAIFPNYHLAAIGKGKLLAAGGDLDAAAALLNSVNDRVRTTDAEIWLGSIYAMKGDDAAARSFWAMAETTDAAGHSGELSKSIAVLWANQGQKLDEAVALANREYGHEKDVFTADAVAWTLFKAGRLEEAKTMSVAARRIGTKDAGILYHAGMIEHALGNRQEGIRLIREALALDPYFDLLQAEAARRMAAS